RVARAFGALEQQRRPAGFDRSVDDLGDFEARIDLSGDADELTLPLEQRDPGAEVGGRRHRRSVYGDGVCDRRSRQEPATANPAELELLGIDILNPGAVLLTLCFPLSNRPPFLFSLERTSEAARVQKDRARGGLANALVR